MLRRLAGELGVNGRFVARLGRAEDYRKLARFHYASAGPASFALTVAIEHVWDRADAWSGVAKPARGLEPARRVVAVGVLSYPALNCAARERALRLGGAPREWRWAQLNRHLRTISRVIVHPQYRGVGLASEVVRCLLAQAPTRYVEAISRLARHHPLFERAGLPKVSEGYYLVDRLGGTAAGLRLTPCWLT